MITTDKILAHKVLGKNLILLTQVGSSYFVVFAQVVRSKKGIFSKFSKTNSSLKVLGQREVCKDEAQAIFNSFNSATSSESKAESTQNFLSPVQVNSRTVSLALSGTVSSSMLSDKTILNDILLLEGSVLVEKTCLPLAKARPISSPYFPTKDIFLSVQKTRAPATM